jgi:MOSC domain-containing protein YiiM
VGSGEYRRPYFQVNGTIVQLNISRGGLPKLPISFGMLDTLGLSGDAHAHPHIHGGPEKAVLLVTSEGIAELIERGYPLFFGAIGENLTTRGLDRRQLRLGQQFRAGSARIEITRVRVPCANLDVYGPVLKSEIYDSRVQAGDPASPRWGLSGFYARVIEPGMVRTDDIILVEATLA